MTPGGEGPWRKIIGAGDIQTISDVKQIYFRDKCKHTVQKIYKLLNPHRKPMPYFCYSINCMKLHPLWFLCLLMVLAACNNNPDTNGSVTPPDDTNPPPPNLSYTVLKIHPHDTASFVQGLEFYNGALYESTGSPAEYAYPSWLGKIDMKTGKLQHTVTLDSQYFAEGLTIFKDKLYQLTWQSKKGFVYDAKTLKKLGEFTYNTEGWGLTHDSSHLIMSDGSSNLYFMDPVTFRNAKIVGVTDNNGPVSNLNELEYIDGHIYANQWQSPYILKIDPNTGKIVGKLNLDSLVNEVDAKLPGHDYLNGIAYNPDSKTVFVTGKRWPSMYEIRL